MSLAVVSCDALIGAPVVNRRDEELGTLAHVLLDLAQSRIAYAVIAHGGVLGLGERLVPVPWQALSLDAARDCFVLDLPMGTLDRAPALDADDFPSAPEGRWMEPTSL